MAKRCDMCFQEKQGLQPVVPGMPAQVCKACNYKISQVMGFLQYQGAVVSYQPRLSKNSPQPPSYEPIDLDTEPEATKSPKKRRKPAKGGITQD